MANIPTSADFNNEYPVTQWDRTTVADGKWLQENTISPLKERDDYLLSLIDNVNSDIPKVPEIIRVTPQGTSFDIDSLKFIQTSTDTAKIQAGSTIVGSTVVQPTLSSQEGKVPVAYYRDGVGYYLLETYKDSRFPDSKSENMNMILTVDEHGTAVWDYVNSIKYITNQSVTYEQVAKWVNEGNTVIYKVNNGHPQILTYKDTSNYFHFLDITKELGEVHHTTLSTDNTYYTTISIQRNSRFDGGICNLITSESYETIGKLWSTYSTQSPGFPNGELQFEYMSYHAGTLFVTSHIGQADIRIEGFRHDYVNNGSGSVIQTVTRIHTNLDHINKDQRTTLQFFNLGPQELSHNDFTSSCDFVITFKASSSETAWSKPIKLNLTKTQDGKIMMASGN